MKVRDAMSRKIEATRADESVQMAASRMAAKNIGALPVIDGDRIAGFITDRDIAVRGVAKGIDVGSAKVRDVMTTTLHLCRDEDDLESAAHTMKERGVRRLLVTDREGRPAGMLSLGDLARAKDSNGQHAAVDALCAVCEPAGA